MNAAGLERVPPLSVASLLFYKIDRGVHEANLRKLAVATATLEEAEEAGLPRP